METGKIVSDMLLDILPKKIMESGKGRGYFGERILDHWFPELTEDERALVILLAKAALDRAFQPEGVFVFITPLIRLGTEFEPFFGCESCPHSGGTVDGLESKIILRLRGEGMKIS